MRAQEVQNFLRTFSSLLFMRFDFSLCSDRGCNRAAASRGHRVDVHFQPTKHTVKPPCGSSRSYVVPSLLFIRPWMLFRRLPRNSAARVGDLRSFLEVCSDRQVIRPYYDVDETRHRDRVSTIRFSPMFILRSLGSCLNGRKSVLNAEKHVSVLNF